MKVRLISMLLLLVVSFMAFSTTLTSFDSGLNTSLLEAMGKRQFFEIGVEGDIFLFQNAYDYTNLLSTIRDFISQDFSLDFVELTDTRTFDFETSDNINGHFLVSIADFGLGVVGSFDLRNNFQMSEDLILAVNKESSQTGEISFYLDTLLKFGLYGSYNFEGISVGVLYNFLLPLVYAPEMSMNYDLNKGSTNSSLFLDTTLQLYSPFNDEDLNEFMERRVDVVPLFSKVYEYGGQSLDIGVTFGESSDPTLGFGVNNIEIKQPTFKNEITYEKTFEISTEGVATPSEDSTLTSKPFSDHVEYPVPLALAGFLRIPFDIFDMLTYGEFLIKDQKINWGVMLKSSFFGFIPLSLGIEYFNDYWATSVGFGLNTRIIENRTEIGLKSKDLDTLIDLRGFTFKTSFAMGF